MSTQAPLFVEDYNDAIRETAIALGGLKKVGVALRPELSADAAGRWLSDCCNPDRRYTLAPEQLGLLRRMARAAGVHLLTTFEMRDSGYADPQPIEPEDERAALQREYIDAVRTLANLQTRIERVGLRVA